MATTVQDDYLRSSLFGVEDALVSTTGMIVGLIAASPTKEFILLASLITIAVEASSMGAGEFLSERAVHQLEKDDLTTNNFIFGGIIMFASYALAGLIPVLPILFFPLPEAGFISVFCAFIGLYLLGYTKGKIVKINRNRSGLEMLIVGGIAAVIGITVGLLLKI